MSRAINIKNKYKICTTYPRSRKYDHFLCLVFCSYNKESPHTRVWRGGVPQVRGRFGWFFLGQKRRSLAA